MVLTRKTNKVLPRLTTRVCLIVATRTVVTRMATLQVFLCLEMQLVALLANEKKPPARDSNEDNGDTATMSLFNEVMQDRVAPR